MRKMILFLILLTMPAVGAYPVNEMAAIYHEAYPGALIGEDITFRDDGMGVYLYYISPGYSVLSSAEMETYWQIVQNKKNDTAANKTIANGIKERYQNHMSNMTAITQAGSMTEAQQTGAIKQLAWLGIDFLKFFKWYYWDSS